MRKITRQLIRLAALLALAASPLLAGRATDHPTRTLRISRLEAAVRVDGRLDEPVWGQLESAADFVQMDPQEGAPVSERTEALVFYDDARIYFGFRCYDSDPAGIVSWLDARDVRSQADSIGIFLDPFGDRRNGYVFTVHASGSQFDAVLSEGSEPDSTWDGIWQSSARIEDWGWAVEVAIPFKSIRFAAGHPWGINLRRDIARKNERAFWQFIPRFDGRFRPAKAGLLEGIADVQPGRNMEVVPYFSTRFRRGATNSLNNGENFEGGADLRWGILPNATLNLALNPDFAETEADEENISISRFELFFPEKRNFFNEGSNFFRTPLNLFFTRRVGARLPDALPQRILLGAKLTGKLAGWSLGMLEARTQEKRFADPATGAPRIAPAANFFVLRMQRDIWENSTIGFLTVNRDQSRSLGAGDSGSTQRVHALDLNLISGPHLRWSTQAAYNQNQTSAEAGIHRAAFRSQFNFETSHWEIRGRYKYLGRGFDVSAIGFEPETDRHSSAAAVRWRPFVNRHGIRQVFFELNQDISFDTRGLLQDSGSDADLTAEFKNFWVARLRYSYDRVRFNEFTATPNCAPPFACSPAFGRGPGTRLYLEPRLRFFLHSNATRPVSFAYDFLWRKFAQFRDNFYGRGQTHTLSLTARVFRRTRVQFSGTHIRELLLDGTPFQDRRQFVTRLNHQFTPKLRVRVLGQVSNDRLGQNFSLNSIVAYDFTARSAAIVGYNYQRRSPLGSSDLGNEFFAKFSYLFHF